MSSLASDADEDGYGDDVYVDVCEPCFDYNCD